MRFVVAPAIIALTSSFAPAPATAAVLQPVAGWDLDYGETQCTAGRSFAAASGTITLGLVPSLSGKSYRLLVSVPRPGPRFARESRGSVDFGGGAISSPLLYFGGKRAPFGIYQFRLPAEVVEQARSASAATVRTGDGEVYRFALSDMPALLHGLRNCTADLQRYWNLGGATVTVAEAPARDIPALLTPGEYPTEAMDRNQRRPARYQLMIDQRGRVAGCDVLASSGLAIVDSTGCEVIEARARFRPAMDRSGMAVRSVWTTAPVVWGSADDHFNNGCMWVTDAFVLSQCGRSDADRIRRHGGFHYERRPPPLPPPPSSQQPHSVMANLGQRSTPSSRR